MTEKSIEVVCEGSRRMDNEFAVVPDDVLDLVVERLCLPDLYRFGMVSKLCKSVCDPLQFSDHLPWLIVPFINNINNSTPTSSMAFDDTKDVGFFSLRDGKVYRAELPELSNRRICGSFPGGWLMTVHENSQVQLFNPLRSSSRVIHLPPLTNFPGVVDTIERNEDGVSSRFYMVSICSRDVLRSSKCMRDTYIFKVAMSSSLVSEGTIIMAIQDTNQTLAFYRIGGDQQVWTPIARAVGHGMLHDLTYYNGKFYAVHNGGYVVVVNGLEETQEETPDTSKYLEKIINYPPGDIALQHYILESSGDLLVVRRYVARQRNAKINNDGDKARQFSHKTVGFKVFKVEFGTPCKWVAVENLGDRSLFLGYNSSFSVLSSKFSGCKPNCIYFTDNIILHFYRCKFGGQDFGIFHLEDGSIEKFLYPDDYLMVLTSPIWFAPNLAF